MLIRASCLAAVAVLLCLDLTSGHFYHGESRRRVGYEDPVFSPVDWPNDFDHGHSSSRSFGGRSMDDDEDVVSDGTDVLLTKAQYRQLYKGQGAVRGRAHGHTTIAKPWTNGIVPYFFDKRYTFDDIQKAWISRGMRSWENVTCVRFVPAIEGDPNYLAIWKGHGCFAGLGMSENRVQAVSLPDTCYFRTSIEHELGHTLGLMHEHQRPNRDDYIWVNNDTLIPSGVSQLMKYWPGSDDKFGLPYDYDSVMHYDKTAYTKGAGKQTIYPKLVSKTDVIGNAMVPSFYDIKLVNLMYNCKAKCKSPPRYCREPCFVNEKCQCFCEKDAPKEVCQDDLHECALRAAEGDCERQSRYMLHYCRLSCGACKLDGTAPQLPCLDMRSDCTRRSCQTDGRAQCKKTCKICPDNNKQPRCVDSLRDCAQRAGRGECKKNPEMMLTKCTRSCRFCYRKQIYRSYYPFN